MLYYLWPEHFFGEICNAIVDSLHPHLLCDSIHARVIPERSHLPRRGDERCRRPRLPLWPEALHHIVSAREEQQELQHHTQGEGTTHIQ